jgi:hypothetical protein
LGARSSPIECNYKICGPKLMGAKGELKRLKGKVAA